MNSNNLNKDIFYKSDDLVVSSSLFTTSTPTKKGEYDRGSETSHINKKLMNIQNNIMDTDFIPNDSYGSTTFKKNTDGIINHYGGRRKGSGDSASVRVPLDATDTISTSAYTSSFTPSSYSLSSYTPSNYPSSYSTITSSDIDDRSSSSSTTTTDSSSVTNSNDSDSDQHLDHKKTENSKPKKIKQKSEGGKKKDPSNESKNKESNDKKSIKKKHK